MAKVNRPVLGTIECGGCGGEATVHQAARGKGRYLYTRCPNCGADQRNGASVQSHIWHNANWREGVEKVMPPNVQADDDWKPASAAPKKSSDEKPVISAPKNDAPPERSSGNAGLIIGGLGVVTIAGVILWKVKQKPAPKTNQQPLARVFDERLSP